MRPTVQNQSEVKEFTINLAQAAATYDLFTASGDVAIEDISYYVSTVGATFTSVAVQTNDTTVLALVSAVEGAVANILAGKTLRPAAAQSFQLRSGKKVQYVIVGVTGTGAIKAVVRFRPITGGATIA